MIQIKNKDGQPVLELVNFIKNEDSPLVEYKIIINYDCFHVTFNHKTESSDFKLLEERLLHLYQFEYREILFDTIDSKLIMKFHLTDSYHIMVKVILLNDDYSGRLEIEFETDQTLITELLSDLSNTNFSISEKI